MRKSEMGRNMLKAVTGKERAGSRFYPGLWSPRPVLLPCKRLFINLQKPRGHFLGIVFAMDQRPAAG